MATTPGTITGPITGGSHGWPFGGPSVDLEALGYVEEEFFIDGSAERYRLVDGATMSADGHWDVEAVEQAGYRTRFVVYRPVDADRFNGTVVVGWNNVTAGYDIFDMVGDGESLRGGYAYVLATPQRVGVHGAGDEPLGLVAWDGERYGDLAIPSDDYSYDIFTQIVAAVGPGRVGPVDPLAGLEARRVVAVGSSQSAGRLATYINAIHDRDRLIDGYLLTVYMGFGLPLEIGDYVIDTTAEGPNPGPALEAANLLREIDARVMVVNSELESRIGRGFRQPDADGYRCWEVAGACHTSLPAAMARVPKLMRDFGTPVPASSARPRRRTRRPTSG